jgi:hypothetical protein
MERHLIKKVNLYASTARRRSVLGIRVFTGRSA